MGYFLQDPSCKNGILYQRTFSLTLCDSRVVVDNKQNKAAESEYEDDFEAAEDAEDEEDDNCRDMLMKWTDDQGN